MNNKNNVVRDLNVVVPGKPNGSPADAYRIGKGVYEITRSFEKEKKLKDVILEIVTCNNSDLFSW